MGCTGLLLLSCLGLALLIAACLCAGADCVRGRCEPWKIAIYAVAVLSTWAFLGPFTVLPVLSRLLQDGCSRHRFDPELACDMTQWYQHFARTNHFCEPPNLTGRACTEIGNGDVVRNLTVAEDCLASCHRVIGASLDWLAMLDWTFWVSYFLETDHNGGDWTGHYAATLRVSCWKAAFGGFALRFVPAWAGVFVAALYGFVGLDWAALHAEDKPVTEKPSDTELSDELANTALSKLFWWRPALCDAQAARRDLLLQAAGMIIEPASDVWSLVTFARKGQPVYFTLVMMGVLVTMSQDFLQARGLKAVLESWKQGFPTKELFEHKVLEFPESFITTFVQVYAVSLRMWSQTDWASWCSLGFFACLSIRLTFPSIKTAQHLLEQSSQHTVDFQDFYSIEKAKKTVQFKTWPSEVLLVSLLLGSGLMRAMISGFGTAVEEASYYVHDHHRFFQRMSAAGTKILSDYVIYLPLILLLTCVNLGQVACWTRASDFAGVPVNWRAVAAAIIRPHHQHKERELRIAQMLLSGTAAAFSVTDVLRNLSWYIADSHYFNSEGFNNFPDLVSFFVEFCGIYVWVGSVWDAWKQVCRQDRSAEESSEASDADEFLCLHRQEWDDRVG